MKHVNECPYFGQSAFTNFLTLVSEQTVLSVSNIVDVIKKCAIIVGMKKYDFWEEIEPNDKSMWVKLPCWAISFLNRYGIYDIEQHVLLFLVFSTTLNPKEVYAPTYLGVKFASCNERTFFRAIKKLKGFGLKKNGNGKYDLTDLISNLAKEKKKYTLEKEGLLTNIVAAKLLEGLE